MIPLFVYLYARKRRAQNRHLAEITSNTATYPENDAGEDRGSLQGTTAVETMANERTPLLDHHSRNFWEFPGFGGTEEAGNSILTASNGKDDGKRDPKADLFHLQFCQLVGVPSSDTALLGNQQPAGHVPPKSLYGRAVRDRNSQGRTYAFTAALSNTLLLSQVVLGAALTALGASESSHVLITLFGATNTIIAGVVAYLKSRGQPMRARMFRDDLERVVDEIENSEIMWRGKFCISKNMHGYGEIPLHDGTVTVRSEVARLTRLYDRTIRTNSMNNPDMYQSELFSGITSGTGGINKLLRQAPTSVIPAVVQVPVVTTDPDQSPATQSSVVPTTPLPSDGKKDDSEKKSEEPKTEDKKDGGTGDLSAGTPAPPPPPPPPPAQAVDPDDESPATRADVTKGKQPAKE